MQLQQKKMCEGTRDSLSVRSYQMCLQSVELGFGPVNRLGSARPLAASAPRSSLMMTVHEVKTKGVKVLRTSSTGNRVLRE